MVVDPRNYSIILIQNQTFTVAQLSYYEAWNIANNYSVIWVGVKPYINFGPIDSEGFFTLNVSLSQLSVDLNGI